MEKHLISFSCILFLIFNALWSVFKNQVVFSKMLFFPDFQLIQFVFWSIEIAFKIFCEPLSISINQNLWIRFFKKSDLTCSKHFFKNFSNLFLSLRLDKAPQRFFCRFPPNFLQSFSLPKLVCLFYPSFCIVFLIFMHYLMVFG